MMQLLADPQAWLAFLTLTALELVLGIDNVIFIAILVDKLPQARRGLARRLGLFLAMFMRVGLLFLLSVLVGLTEPILSVSSLRQDLSGRDLILIGGGLFLIWKSTREIHDLMAGGGHGPDARDGRASFGSVLAQIVLIDIIFSLDSIITAVGLVDDIEIMIAAVVVSVALMMAFSGAIARFISPRPTIKMLALAFLFMIGLVLIADGFGHHIPKGYVYFAMAFSVLVEMLNMRMRRKKA
jgi:predicted tellurium resistance membrane protein TerC